MSYQEICPDRTNMLRANVGETTSPGMVAGEDFFDCSDDCIGPREVERRILGRTSFMGVNFGTDLVCPRTMLETAVTIEVSNPGL